MSASCSAVGARKLILSPRALPASISFRMQRLQRTQSEFGLENAFQTAAWQTSQVLTVLGALGCSKSAIRKQIRTVSWSSLMRVYQVQAAFDAIKALFDTVESLIDQADAHFYGAHALLEITHVVF